MLLVSSSPRCLPHCHLSLDVTSSPPSSHSDKQMNGTLSTGALSNEGTASVCVCQGKIITQLPFLNELQRAVTSEKWGRNTLHIHSHALTYMHYLTPTHIKADFPVLFFECVALYLSAAESHFLLCFVTRNPLSPPSLPVFSHFIWRCLPNLQ